MTYQSGKSFLKRNRSIKVVLFRLVYFSNSFVDMTFDSISDDTIFVATDEDMEYFESGQVSRLQLINDLRLMKGIRRRNFLDICRETLSYGFLAA